MRADVLLAAALLCAARAQALSGSGSGRTLYVAPEPSGAGPRVLDIDNPLSTGRRLRSRRDAATAPALPTADIPTWVNHLNDSHRQLMVHWVGEGSRVVICLARDPAPRKLASALYISYDYGATFTDKTESFRVRDHSTEFAQLDKFYNHPKYPQYCIFVDVNNKIIFYTPDNGINIGRTALDFVPSDVIYHQYFPEKFLIHDQVDSKRRLYLTYNGGRTFSLLYEFVQSFKWVWGDGDIAGTLYYHRIEPSSPGELLRYSFASPWLAPQLQLSDVLDFQAKGEFMFATQTHADGGVQLLISHSLGPFFPAEFETEQPLLKFQVADVTENHVMMTVLHSENLTSLYVSRINANFTQYKFALGLSAVMAHFPFATFKGSWLQMIAKEAFTDLYSVKGIAGVYVATRVKASAFGEELKSVISFDHGITWAPIAPPLVDENGTPINCRLENSCSLQLSQQYGQLNPLTRFPSIMSSKSAPGVIIATGVLGESMKGVPGVFLSRDAGVSWKRVLKDYYLYNVGDHGGVLVALKYFKAGGDTRRLLFSTDEGLTWHSHQFFNEGLRMYGLQTELGENTTTFTMFGSLGDQQWIIITVDLINTFARKCIPGDYYEWSPAAPNSSYLCSLGTRYYYERRVEDTHCLNTIDYNGPVKRQECEFSGSEYESSNDYQKIYEKLGDNDAYTPDSVPIPVSGPSEFLLVALHDKIAKIDLKTNETTLIAVPDMKNVIVLEFDLSNEVLYWADIDRNYICRKSLINGTSTYEVVVQTDIGRIEGMALDIISNVLFFVDSLRKTIEAVVIDLPGSGRLRRTIVRLGNSSHPRGIAVHPTAGYLFWTDWSREDPSISRANLDGSNIQKLFGKLQVTWPNGITIDQIAERIYWVDARNNYIASADLDGRNLKKVLWNDKRVKRPYSVAVLRDRVYWDDWATGFVFSADKNRGDDVITLLKSNTLRVMDLKVYAPYKQHGSNACSRDNTCAAMCLGGPRGTFSCLCPDGLSGEDGRCLCPGGAEPYANMTCPVRNDTCGSNEWRCGDGVCVKAAQRCDGDRDCSDGTDELNCSSCDKTDFACASGECIRQAWRCDGDHDCVDFSDERGCPASLLKSSKCEEGKFRCPDSAICIPLAWVCDGENDCDARPGPHADEDPALCANRTCTNGMLQCAGNSNCIYKSWLCDGEDDCHDQGHDGLSSDEQNCTLTTDKPRATTVAAPPHVGATDKPRATTITPLPHVGATDKPRATTITPLPHVGAIDNPRATTVAPLHVGATDKPRATTVAPLHVGATDKPRATTITPLPHVGTTDKPRATTVAPPHVGATDKPRATTVAPLRVGATDKPRATTITPLPHVGATDKPRATTVTPLHVGATDKPRATTITPLPHVGAIDNPRATTVAPLHVGATDKPRATTVAPLHVGVTDKPRATTITPLPHVGAIDNPRATTVTPLHVGATDKPRAATVAPLHVGATDKPRATTITPLPQVGAIDNPRATTVAPLHVGATDKPRATTVAPLHVGVTDKPRATTITPLPHVGATDKPRATTITPLPQVGAIDNPRATTVAPLHVGATDKPRATTVAPLHVGATDKPRATTVAPLNVGATDKPGATTVVPPHAGAADKPRATTVAPLHVGATDKPGATTVVPPHAGATNSCLDWMFECGNGACVAGWWKCDKEDDCGDGSDELGCNYTNTRNTSTERGSHTTQVTCLLGQFTCSPGECIPLAWVCDTEHDCSNDEDERDCQTPQATMPKTTKTTPPITSTLTTTTPIMSVPTTTVPITSVLTTKPVATSTAVTQPTTLTSPKTPLITTSPPTTISTTTAPITTTPDTSVTTTTIPLVANDHEIDYVSYEHDIAEYFDAILESSNAGKHVHTNK